mmetsp:Transcript_43830/g.93822  ORF Transcript_43830/g.93822 Transcript_43830/m.93822 type:complete len:204 (-) Transcript_43830:34-645(-)
MNLLQRHRSLRPTQELQTSLSKGFNPLHSELSILVPCSTGDTLVRLDVCPHVDAPPSGLHTLDLLHKIPSDQLLKNLCQGMLRQVCSIPECATPSTFVSCLVDGLKDQHVVAIQTAEFGSHAWVNRLVHDLIVPKLCDRQSALSEELVGTSEDLSLVSPAGLLERLLRKAMRGISTEAVERLDLLVRNLHFEVATPVRLHHGF